MGTSAPTGVMPAGPALNMLRIGLPVLAFLVLFSFSRRSGPVRELPAPVRATPIEFVEALGSLYGNAGAASTAVSVAWERFRRAGCGCAGSQTQRMDAEELAARCGEGFRRRTVRWRRTGSVRRGGER